MKNPRLTWFWFLYVFWVTPSIWTNQENVWKQVLWDLKLKGDGYHKLTFLNTRYHNGDGHVRTGITDIVEGVVVVFLLEEW